MNKPSRPLGTNTWRSRRSTPYSGLGSAEAVIVGAAFGSVVGTGFPASSSAACAHAVPPVNASKHRLVPKRMIPPAVRHYILQPTESPETRRNLLPDAAWLT